MSERTYRREDIEASRQAWIELMPRESQRAMWNEVRTAAAERGMLFPPSGTRWDDWTDPEPTQFAIIARAHRDTPATLLAVVRSSRSWSQVVAKVMQDRDRRAEDADLEERGIEWEKQYEPTDRQAVERLGMIVERIRESLP